MGRPLVGPLHRRIGRSDSAVGPAATASETASARGAFNDLQHCDYIVVDTPGNDTHLARVAHLNADTLITPLLDLDLDLSELNDRRASSRSSARRELGELLQTIGISAPRQRAEPPASAA